MNKKKMIITLGIILCIAALFFVLYVHTSIMKYAPEIKTPSGFTGSTTSVAIIFGGGMKKNGEMSDMQWDRVQTGIEMYNTKKVGQLFITGDDGALHADEISAMRKRIVDAGVPASDLLIDPHGYRTYESCWRENRVYGLQNAVAISQSFHLPRIMYLCEHLGVHITPVAADVRDYHSLWVAHVREWLARMKAVLQIEITRPLPRIIE
jgi:vancomycin permeability regulator SanA